jgi:hypothetical protein
MIKRLNDITNIYRSSNSLTKVYRGVNLIWNSVVPIIWDVDALDYISRVETADAQTLEEPYKVAYNDFIIGLKTESLWDSLTDIAPMAGARTFAGGLVKMKSSTVNDTMTSVNMNTVGTYDRQNGFTGDGIDDYINTNAVYEATELPYVCIWPTVIEGPADIGIRCYLGAESSRFAICDNTNNGTVFNYVSAAHVSLTRPTTPTPLSAAKIDFVANIKVRQNNTTGVYSRVNAIVYSSDIFLFRRTTGINFGGATLKGFGYSQNGGPDIDLGVMQSLWSDLFTTIDALL